MDLDDSFTRNLMHRTMMRREEVNKKLGLTPEVPLSSKRRRTPLAEENSAVHEENENTGMGEDSESPKRQRFTDKQVVPVETVTASSACTDKENSPVVPVLGLKGLAALKRRNQENGVESSATVSLQSAKQQHEHEESQGFMKSPSTRKLTYTYPEGDPETANTVKDRMKMFESAEPASSNSGPNGAPAKAVQRPAPTFKKPSAVSMKKTTVQQHLPNPSHAGNDESSFEVDPADMSMASKRALFEAPLIVTETPKEHSPEKLSVSQRTALFERAMLSPNSKSNRTRKEPPKFVPTPNMKLSTAKPSVQTSPSKTTLEVPATKPWVQASPAKPTVQPSPAKPLVQASPAKPSAQPSPAKRSVQQSPAKPSAQPSPAKHSVQPSPAKPSVQASPAKPSVQASPAKPSIQPSPAKCSASSSFRASPIKTTTPDSPVRPLVQASPVKPSNSILRKPDDHAVNGSGKTVRFGVSPSKGTPAHEQLPQGGGGQNTTEVPKSPRLGSHTQELQQRLLVGLQKSTSTSRMVEKSIAERRKEMERLLFNKRPEDEDSMVSQDGSDVTQDSQTESSMQDTTATEETSQLSDEQTKGDESRSSDSVSHSTFSSGHGDVSDALDEELQSQMSDEDMETEQCTPVSQTAAKNLHPTAGVGTAEDMATPLMHSVSVYRRQKQALCTPPVRVIQRKPLVDSPPSPPHPGDAERIQELQSRIQYLQECLHCQNVQVRQASQALSLCSAKPELFGSPEHIEGERLLLIASQKRNAYRNTLERLKTEAALGTSSSHGNVMGTLTMSQIRLPLKHDFLSAQMAGIIGDAVHFFFCLIRYQDKVITTEMLSTRGSDITAGTLSFTNHICIQELENNFQVHFEVYALQASGENLVNHERKHSLKRDHAKARVKKLESKAKLSPALSSPVTGQINERTSNFGLVGFIPFTVENCNQKIMVLDKVPSCSPLDGRMYIKLQLCTQQPVKEQGFLTMFEDVSGFGAWHRRWVVLNGSHISFWKYPDQVHAEIPIGSIDLRTCVTPEVGLVSADVCARKNTFMLFCIRPRSQQDRDNLVNQSQSNRTTTKYLISADTKEERILWCKQLNAALEIIRRWDPQALNPKDYPLNMQC